MFLRNRKFGHLQQQNYVISSVMKRFFSSHEFFSNSAWYLVVGSDTGYTIFKKVTDHLDLEKQRSEWRIFYPSTNTYTLMLQCSSTMFPTISPSSSPTHLPTSGKYERTQEFSLTILFFLFEPTRPTTRPTAHPTMQGVQKP